MTKTRLQLDVNELNNYKMNELRSTFKVLKDLTGNASLKTPTNKTDMVAVVSDLYEQYQEDLALEIGNVSNINSKSKTKRKNKYTPNTKVKLAKPVSPREGTIEHTLVAAITNGYVTVEEITQYVLENHERPRSLEGVDEDYAKHNIKWFVNKGHLKLAK